MISLLGLQTYKIIYYLVYGSFFVPQAYDLSHSPSRAFMNIGDQGQCGSCGAFALTHAYSMRLYLQYGIDYLPSPYALMNCYRINCSDGLSIEFIVKRMNNFRLADEGRARPIYDLSACDIGNSSHHNHEQNVEFYVINFQSAVKADIYFNGPIAVSVAVDDQIWRYSGDSDTILPCLDASVHREAGHMVVLVGWGENYWIIKNSWGYQWGSGGYAKISIDCLDWGIAVQPVLGYNIV